MSNEITKNPLTVHYVIIKMTVKMADMHSVIDKLCD